jgi:hypothetical protein
MVAYPMKSQLTVAQRGSLANKRSCHGLNGLAEIAAADTTQAKSFSSAWAPARDEAGFWPVTSFPSVTTKLAQSAAFS